MVETRLALSGSRGPGPGEPGDHRGQPGDGGGLPEGVKGADIQPVHSGHNSLIRNHVTPLQIAAGNAVGGLREAMVHAVGRPVIRTCHHIFATDSRVWQLTCMQEGDPVTKTRVPVARPAVWFGWGRAPTVSARLTNRSSDKEVHI